MRYEKGRKEVTRRRIIEVASQRFRSDGVAAVGLAGLMSDAGLTNGAFYAHFDSKENLVQEVLVEALDRRLAYMKTAAGQGATLGDAIRDYLSTAMRAVADTAMSDQILEGGIQLLCPWCACSKPETR